MGKSFTVDLRSLHGLDTHQLAAVALEADRLEALYEGRGREAVATLFGVIAMGARSLMKRPAPGEHAGFVVHDPSAPKLDTVDDLGAAIAAMLALANDSGALILEIGAAYLLVFTGFAWVEKHRNSGKSSFADEKLQLRAPNV